LLILGSAKKVWNRSREFFNSPKSLWHGHRRNVPWNVNRPSIEWLDERSLPMPLPKRRSTKANSHLSFNHAMVYVRQVAPALHFYVDQLGFKLIERFEHKGYAVYARLRSPRGNTTLALHTLEPGQTLPETEGVRLYLEVNNLDAFCKKLEGSGVKFLQAPKLMPWGWRHAYLKDPDGHELSLYYAGAKRYKKTTMKR
jgi:catechol 2,3-dioxygenase-like lactoylglutathione lyase family enzyme